MANTLNYLRRPWLESLWPARTHPLALPYLFLLVTIPLPHAVNNIALMLFAAASLFWFRKHFFFRSEWQLWLPPALFALMALSVAWSVNPSRSGNSLAKEISLLAVPVCCMLFPVFSRSQKSAILERYAYGMAVFGGFYILRALFRYGATHDQNVFFYHELVTKEVNAIHVSVYMAVAFFALLPKAQKKAADWFCLVLLGVLLVLLSSKNIIVVFVLLLVVYGLFFSGLSVRKRAALIAGLLLLTIVPVLVFGKIAERFQMEYDTIFAKGTVNQELSNGPHKVYNVSVSQAWQQEKFQANDYFPGTAFRVYQVRIFFEMLQEDPIFFTGYGLNASNIKIRGKAVEHQLWLGDGKEMGYQGKNFHNQYVQNFADLGIFGLLLLLAMVVLNLKNGIAAKDFTHISFAVLMISLFLTESFLWRQRGVVFFTAMYCLFNAGPVAFAASKKE